MLLANLANALFDDNSFYVLSSNKKAHGVKKGLMGFVAYFIAFEYLHLDWDLTWPWLTLGNVFAKNIDWVQWYEYTGVFGGSLWILVLNALFFSWIKIGENGFLLNLQPKN